MAPPLSAGTKLLDNATAIEGGKARSGRLPANQKTGLKRSDPESAFEGKASGSNGSSLPSGALSTIVRSQ